VRSELTAEDVRKLLRYDPKTGKMFWRLRSNGRVPEGIEGSARLICSNSLMGNTMGKRKNNDLSYQERKVLHWNRFGTPAQIDPETGAAAPKWVIEERDARRKKDRDAAKRRSLLARGVHFRHAQAAE
jgi:hypothetical protein